MRVAESRGEFLERAAGYLAELLDELPAKRRCDVFIERFEVRIHGRVFGLVDDSEPSEGYERITLWPNDLAFFPPYGGQYDT